MYTRYYDEPYLMHHGIKGMRWGVRRFQNRDGSLTSAGRNRYGDGSVRRGSKKPLTAAQKAERKRKLIKGAKIAAAALGTAAVVGGGAYAMKRSSAANARAARDRRNEQLRRHAEDISRILWHPIGKTAPDGSYEALIGTVRPTNRRDANQSFKDFNRRAGDANRSLGSAEARVREYREGIRDNMRQLDELDNVMNQISEELRRRNNGR